MTFEPKKKVSYNYFPPKIFPIEQISRTEFLYVFINQLHSHLLKKKILLYFSIFNEITPKNNIYEILYRIIQI